MVGCDRTGKFRMSEDEFQMAKREIAERELNSFMRTKYKRPRDYKVVDYPTTLQIKNTCYHLLNIDRKNIEVYKGGTLDYTNNYRLLDSSIVNLPKYQECIIKKLYSIDVDDKALHEMVNSQDYLKFKDMAELNELLQQIKADGRVTLGEAEDVYAKIYKLEKEIEEVRYKSAIENL